MASVTALMVLMNLEQVHALTSWAQTSLIQPSFIVLMHLPRFTHPL
jgi:hypothetical protein